jgi:hypothetical protein
MMRRKLVVTALSGAALVAAAVGGASSLVSADPGVKPADSAFVDPNATVDQAYSIFGRPRAAEDGTRNLTAVTSSRRAMPNVYLWKENDTLCIGAADGDGSGGAACGKAALAAADPPMLSSSNGEQTVLTAAIPDGITEVTVLSTTGEQRVVKPSNNAIQVTISGDYAGATLTRSDGLVYSMPTAGPLPDGPSIPSTN